MKATIIISEDGDEITFNLDHDPPPDSVTLTKLGESVCEISAHLANEFRSMMSRSYIVERTR